MTRRQLAIAVAALVVLVALAALLLVRPGADETGGEAVDAETTAAPVAAAVAEQARAFDLYFPGGGGGLHGERREIPIRDSVEEQIAALVETLIAGPEDDRFRAPLPDEVTVRRVYLVDEGEAGNTEAGGTTVYLDLESPEGQPPPASGSHRELLTVFSLVNTILLNVESAEKVVLLWNGQQSVTFAGHLYTARALTVNSALIASRP